MEGAEHAEEHPEAALRASEARYRLASEIADLGTWTWDLVTDAATFDARVAELFAFGREAPQPRVDVLATRVHPEDRARVDAALAGAADPAGDGRYRADFRVVHPDGTIRFVRAAGQMQFADAPDGAGRRPVFLVGTVLDATAEHAREAALRAAVAAERRAREAAEAERRRVDRIVAQVPAPVAVFEGPELRFRALSAAYQRIIGGREVLGRPIREALPELSGGEGGANFFALLDGVYATGQAVERTDERADWDDNADGAAEVHIVDLVYAPLRGLSSPAAAGDDPVDGVIALVLDVTARARAEAALRESESRFRNVADAAPVMLWVTDPDGACTFLNRSWLEFTGQALDEGLGSGWLDAVHPEHREAADRAFREASAARGAFRTEYRLRRRDGTYHWCIDAAAPRTSDDGRHLGYVGSVVDVEAQYQARVAAEQANRTKSQFLATMSHELRTPLNAIGGYVELLLLGIRGALSEAQRADLERVRKSQHHLLGLINEVLNYARLESGAVRYDLRPTAVADVLAEAVPLLDPQRAAKGITMRVAVAPDAEGAAARVHADAEKLQQILLNLLSNAVKFTRPGGHVAVSVARVAGGAAVRVSDTGVGIAPDKLEAIFEPFVQVGRGLSTPGEGAGLGLAISRDLARGMGGDLTVESTPGEGSTFTLTLPAAG